jgi:uncharacterized protein YbaR (Trm112 family)/ubiquinone/menaquinone biosynthesis C-methylase UbiE
VRILDRLCCPTCREELDLRSFIEENMKCMRDDSIPDRSNGPERKSDERTIKEGVLLCRNCKVWYPIYSYVPVMLVFETDLHKKFAKDHAEQLLLLSEYRMPNGLPQPGERSIQETFTDEWECIVGDELTFTYSMEDVKLMYQDVLLKWVGYSHQEIKSILNVGCGLGHESIALQEMTDNAEVFAIDLNFAVLKSGETFKSRLNLHFIVASLFCLPFNPASFDLVCSQGVIHHTFSTFGAFKSIASYVPSNGYLFIWVYGLEDHLVRHGGIGLLTRTNYMVERILRPLVSRSPKVLRDIFFSAMTLMLHPLIKTRVRHKKKWSLKNTEHDLRDWLSPRYAHRHSYNEVIEWFEVLGFRIVDVQSPEAYRRLFHKRLWGVGVTGKKI